MQAENKKHRSVREIAIDSFTEMFRKRVGRLPKKDDLMKICKMVQDFDSDCPVIPSDDSSEAAHYDWIGQHYKEYQYFLYSFDIKIKLN